MTGEGADFRWSGANIEHAGEHNQRVILSAIRVHGPITRPELVRLTGLAHPTVSKIVAGFTALGLVTVIGRQSGRRGQPGATLAIAPDGAFSIGINIDRDHVTIVVVDYGGSIRGRRTFDIDFPSPRQVQAYYRQALPHLLASAEVAPAAIVGIGVALPDDFGIVPLPGRPVEFGQWATTSLPELFAHPLAVPVLTENDAAAAAIGEMTFGRGQKIASFFFLLITYALGGGLVVNAKYARGAHGRSGEIGFLMVDDGNGEQCQLQTIVSLAGLLQRCHDAGLERKALSAPIAAGSVMASVVEHWIEAAAQALVEPLIAISCLIDPDAILIGGRLPISVTEQLALCVAEMLRTKGSNAPVLAPVKAAILAEDAAAVGAALLPFPLSVFRSRDRTRANSEVMVPDQSLVEIKHGGRRSS